MRKETENPRGKRMRVLEKLVFGLIFSLSLWLSLPGSLQAANTGKLDLNARGRISVTMREREEGKPIGGGSLTLYRVAGIDRDDGNLFFVLTPDFAGSGVTLDGETNLLDGELAETLDTYVKEEKLTGTEKTIGSDGKAVFTEVPVGLYLIRQTKAAPGYYPVSPFLVSMPLEEGEEWIYQVDAEPKTEVCRPKPPEPEKPERPKEPNKPSQPPHEVGHPKTGDHASPGSWAAVILCTLVCIFGIGQYQRSEERRKRNP